MQRLIVYYKQGHINIAIPNPCLKESEGIVYAYSECGGLLALVGAFDLGCIDMIYISTKDEG